MVHFDFKDLICQNYTEVTIHTFLEIVKLPQEARQRSFVRFTCHRRRCPLSILNTRKPSAHEKHHATELISPNRQTKEESIMW
jgi:hypothetical protein